MVINFITFFQVVFEFMSGIEESLANKLKATGIIVKGEIFPNSHPVVDCDNDLDSSEDESVTDRYICILSQN